MINFIEALFGIGIGGGILAIGLRAAGRARIARRFAVLAVLALVLGILLELYVRYVP